MASLDRSLRRDLENAVKKARRVADAGARQALEQFAVNHHEPWPTLTPDQRKLRNRLRAHGRQLGDRLDEKKGSQAIDRLASECAYEHWHRLLFARFLAENHLLVEPTSEMHLSLAECRELARERGVDWLVLASDFAQRMLPQIFRVGDPVLEVSLPPEKRQELESLLEALPQEIFVADDSLGWVYQFWQSDQKAEVHESGVKIGAEEISPVTQLFTEDYMVLFLLHNTLGAWWAARELAKNDGVHERARTEAEAREAIALPNVRWDYLRLVRDDENRWVPAAGSFTAWPTKPRMLTILDPCMGSGHFLVFALPLLAAMRAQDEGISFQTAIDAVLRENLFGLEIDPRCTQIAAFNLALTAWRLAGYRLLPTMQLACSGLGINASESDWVRLAGSDSQIAESMKRLYQLFQQGPLLGSLVDPTRIGGDLITANYNTVLPLLEQALRDEKGEAISELAITAFGLLKAAQLLARKYTLVATNVPYLARGKQSASLQEFSESLDATAKGDLAVLFLSRISRLLVDGGAVAVVQPQNWLFLAAYRKFREAHLRAHRICFVAGLGPAAFQDMNWWAIRTSLVVEEKAPIQASSVFHALDLREHREFDEKALLVTSRPLVRLNQLAQLRNPDARIVLEDIADEALLSAFANAFQGVSPADAPRFSRNFWEFPAIRDPWVPWQSTVPGTISYGGREQLLDLGPSLQEAAASGSAYIRGEAAWGKRSVVVSAMGQLPVTLGTGEPSDTNAAVIVPRREGDLAAIWAFCQSDEYRASVRRIDQALKVTNGSLTKVPFEISRWRQSAEIQFPRGLPLPYSEDPTQWLFHGHPAQCSQALHVAVCRLLGFQWPAENGFTGELSPESRRHSTAASALKVFGDDDGIACLSSLRGEAGAGERVRDVLAASFGDGWSANVLTSELARTASSMQLEEWLRDSFFEQHCELFHQRPFIWQVWDGLRTGFSALVSYHRLAASDGEGRRTLEKLIYTYLGDWIDRQRAEQKAGIEGADGRVAASEHLKRELEKILEGDPPYDIFVRWKRLNSQPVGWEPDINDGVRINLRPFMVARTLSARGKNACILRVSPKIKWQKDRGKEPIRSKAEYPWFWGCDGEVSDFPGGTEFDGNRWNDLHYSRAVKLAARESIKGGKP